MVKTNILKGIFYQTLNLLRLELHVNIQQRIFYSGGSPCYTGFQRNEFIE